MPLAYRTRPDLADFGTLTQPSTGKIVAVATKSVDGYLGRLDFTFDAVPISVTDAAASGSHGAFTFFTFNAGVFAFLGSRLDLTSLDAGAIDAGDDDAVGEIGIGTTAISAAADGTLGNGVNENVAQAIAFDLGSATAGTAVTGSTTVDGSSTALKLALNVSVTAAKSDANGTFTVTGTFSVLLGFLKDD